ncbi:MAG: OmpA family protein [Burkholderiaceae bacterium]
MIPRHRLTLVAAAFAAAALAGCASKGPNPTLESARADVNAIAADPVVTSRAALELRAARDTIDQADRVWMDDRDDDEVKHLAYLARQRAEVARNLARSRQTDDQVRDAKNAADRLQLTARTVEADRARAAAEEEQRKAQMARSQAQQAQTQAQQAQTQALTAQQQADAAARAAAAERAQAQAAQNRVRQLEAQLRDIEAKQTERGLLVTLGDVLFAFDKSELLPNAGPRLDRLAAFLKEYPQRRLLVEGYTDGIGSDAYNQQLSQRRAEAVRNALMMRGVDPMRITTRGYGKAYPVADNGSAEGRALNRRVEVVIADEKGVLKGRS